LVETAAVLGPCLILIFGMLDLALVELQSNILSEGARRLARQAALHGALAPPQFSSWGVTAIHGNAGDGSQYAAVIEPILATMSPSDVKIEIVWLDGGNAISQRVQVTLSYSHAAIIPINLYGKSCQLKAVSTMLIQH
jgi:hypothetical protein